MGPEDDEAAGPQGSAVVGTPAEGLQRPLHEKQEIRVTNPVEKKWFAQLGRCLSFEARPAVLHFGGFQVGLLHFHFEIYSQICGNFCDYQWARQVREH